jgi:nicotinamide phosphoribosyltransferase
MAMNQETLSSVCSVLRDQIESLKAENAKLQAEAIPDDLISNNIIMLTDSYKISHWKQYPPGTEIVYSYFESRGGKFPEVAFFGLQYFLKRYLEGVTVTRAKIDQAEEYCDAHLGPGIFNREGWEYILKVHGGVLPISIKAVPEGTVVPVKNAMMTVENTDPKCYWLVNYMETLLVQVWYPMTVCTQSRAQKEMIYKYLLKTGAEDPSCVNLMLHDFGFRGVSSVESAATGGAAHLVNFMGTDTMAGYVCARMYYNEPMAGISVPAAEHSTITSWGRENESDAFKNMLTSFPAGLVSVVSDSYDIYNACSNIWGKELKELIENRPPITDDKGNVIVPGRLIVRPDSGEPKVIVVECLEKLGEAFGTTVCWHDNVLAPHHYAFAGHSFRIRWTLIPHSLYIHYAFVGHSLRIRCTLITHPLYYTPGDYRRVQAPPLLRPRDSGRWDFV